MPVKRDVERLSHEAPVFRRLGAGGAKGLGDLLDGCITLLNILRHMVFNAGLSDAGVGLGTNTTKVRTTAAFTYKIAGEFKTKAATDDFWTLTGGSLADGFARKYLLLIDAAGAAAVLASNDAKTAAGCVFDPEAVLAALESKAIVGVLTVETSGAAFVPGTTALSAGTVTDTYLDGMDPSLLPPLVPALV